MKKLLLALIIAVFTLPLSALTALAQPITSDVASLELSEVKLWSGSVAPLLDRGSLASGGGNIATSQVVAAAQAVDPSNKWAVVIGISDYQGTQNDLWNPDEDAREMKQALVNNYGFSDSNILMLLDSSATAQVIVDAINWLAGVEDASSTVVFFFSGHGYRVPDSKGWDSDREADRYDECIVSYDMYALTDGFLKGKFANFETSKFALVFCSCYSGGMFDDRVVDLRAPGRVICSACKANQYGWDYLALGNTLFGYYFVDEGILQGHADKNGDGVSMEEALAYAYPRVTAVQRKSQPQIYDGFLGELVP